MSSLRKMSHSVQTFSSDIGSHGVARQLVYSGQFSAELWNLMHVMSVTSCSFAISAGALLWPDTCHKENHWQFQRGKVEEHQQHGGLGHPGH